MKVTIILNRSKTYKDGTHPICIQVHDKKPKRKVLGRSLEKHWNDKERRPRKTHPDYYDLIDDIEDAYNSAKQIIRKYEREGKRPTMEMVLSGKSLEKITLLHERIEDYADSLDKAGKWQAARKYRNVKRKVTTFRQSEVSEVNEAWMKDFALYLEGEGLAPSTIHGQFRMLKTVLRRENVYDFSVLNFNVSKGQTKHTFLYPSEIDKMYDCEDYELVIDTFLFAYHIWGARIGDVLQLQPNNVDGEILRYTSQKNKKHFEIELNEFALYVIDKYKGGNFILPWLKHKFDHPERWQKKIESKTGLINRELKLVAASLKIKKKLSTHVARHSFAYKCMIEGLTLNQIRDALGHSSSSMTSEYLRGFTGVKELNEVMKRVYR